MKMKSLVRTIGTILLVLSILFVVSCKQEKEKPAEITPEQGQEVVEIGVNIVNSVDLSSLKIDATGALTLDANLKIQNGDKEYLEIKDAHIETCVAEYKVIKKGEATTEPNIGVTTASATIKGKNSTDPKQTVEFVVSAALQPKDVAGETITAGAINIGGQEADLEEDKIDGELVMTLLAGKHLDLTNIIVEDDDDYELNEDLLKNYGEGNISLTLKDVGLVFSGTNKDGTAYSATLALSGSIAVETEAPKAGKRAASIDSNIDFTITIVYGGSNSEFTMKFQEKKSTNDVSDLITTIGTYLNNDLTLESAKALMAEIGLTTTPRYATVNGVQVDATSYLNFLIDYAIQASQKD